jgi:anti-anti-sigma regulatory factor
LARCAQHQCRIVISGLQPQPRVALHRAGFLRSNRVILARDMSEALEKAKAVAGRSQI